MPILAGQIVTADDLNNLKTASYAARATGTLTGIVVNTDVPGATITLTTATNNAVYVAHATFDVDWQGAAAVGNVVVGKLNVDGTLQAGDCNVEQAAGATGDRIPGSQVWRGTLAAAGSHTLKLQASVPSAQQRILNPHTAIEVTIHEVV